MLVKTGVVRLASHYSIGAGAGELPHPLEAWSLRLHGLAAMAGLYVLGLLAAAHIPHVWRLSHRRRRAAQRRSGVLLCVGVVVLATCGYLLYYLAYCSTPETVRARARLGPRDRRAGDRGVGREPSARCLICVSAAPVGGAIHDRGTAISHANAIDSHLHIAPEHLPDTASPTMLLNELPNGVLATVLRVVAASADVDAVALRRLGEIGFIPGEPVQLLRRGPGGREPLAVLIGDTLFGLRLLEAQCVEVQAP